MRKPVESGRTQNNSSATRRVVAYVLPPAVTIAILLVLWQVVAKHNSQAIPPLGPIWQILIGEPRKFFVDSLWTISEMVVGLAASATIAFGLAVLMTHSRIFERAIMPLAVVLNVTPVVAFAPGLVLIFSYTPPRYIVTGVIVFFPFLVNSFVGLREINREALDFFRTLDASRMQILWRLRLPSSLPYLFAAARICVPLSLVGAVVAEFTTTGNASGLGSLIAVDYQQGFLPEVYASVVCLAVIGVLSSTLVVLGERKFLRWSRSART
jgi:NitT/TauT family transport system permease protein